MDKQSGKYNVIKHKALFFSYLDLFVGQNGLEKIQICEFMGGGNPMDWMRDLPRRTASLDVNLTIVAT